jgi:hypothetical protein
LRTVPWLTLKRSASSNSLGIVSPGFHTPDCMSCVISTLIWRYSGLNASLGAARWRATRLVRVGGGVMPPLQHRLGERVTYTSCPMRRFDSTAPYTPQSPSLEFRS